MPRKIAVNSYAKLNLYLAVLNKRPDSYHNIKTLFERIDLHDRITVTSRPDGAIRIHCTASGVPTDRTNLAYRSARLLQESCGVLRGADISIKKRIPVGSGMAGGSSNAAAALLALNRLWRLGLARRQLVVLAKKIGADVPFFLYDLPFAWGLGRGDAIKPIPRLARTRLWHVVIKPDFPVSTPLVYQKYDALPPKVRLTIPPGNAKLIISKLAQEPPSSLAGCLLNSLEQVTLKQYPEVRRIKQALLQSGVKAILMSGSGPAVFGILSSRKEALSLVRKLKKEKSWHVYAARTH